VQKCKITSKSSPSKLHELTIRRAIQIEAAYEACPKTKLVASGYSQGGQVVHNAIGLLPATVAAWSKIILVFLLLVA
jgi:Cutinase